MDTFPAALPRTRVPDPADAPRLRWGIVATGGIAASFVTALREHTRQTAVAVASRSAGRAAAFAARHGIAHSYGSYDELFADPAVDVVYVATPHSGHRDAALAAICAGKHVLVEKAFTRNASEARQVVDAARTAKVFAMEAMWTRFLPQTDVLRQLIDDGALGDISTVLADHGQFFRDVPTSHRLLDPALAGGALLDLGVYPVSFARFALGRPEHVHAVGSLTQTGVDAQVSAVVETASGQAVVNATLLAQTPTVAAVCGSTARAEFSGPFYAPGTLTVTEVGRSGRRLVRPADAIAGSGGLCYEAAEVARRVAAGETESPLLPAQESVEIMETLDEIRAQIGVTYPGE